jgi:hypothetical protein
VNDLSVSLHRRTGTSDKEAKALSHNDFSRGIFYWDGLELTPRTQAVSVSKNDEIKGEGEESQNSAQRVRSCAEVRFVYMSSLKPTSILSFIYSALMKGRESTGSRNLQRLLGVPDKAKGKRENSLLMKKLQLNVVQ